MYNCPDLLTWHQESNSCIPADKNSCSQMKNQAYTTAETTIPSTQLESAIKTTTKSPITISTLSTVSANTIDNQNLDALCANEGAAYLPYPGDCTKFIQCNGLAFVQTCPTNLHWNAALQTCDRFCKN